MMGDMCGELPYFITVYIVLSKFISYINTTMLTSFVYLSKITSVNVSMAFFTVVVICIKFFMTHILIVFCVILQFTSD